MSVEVVHKRDGGLYGRFYCSAAHHTRNDVWCRRQPGHDGDHAAFVFLISKPEYWKDASERPAPF
jgi:hypothetical protein